MSNAQTALVAIAGLGATVLLLCLGVRWLFSAEPGA